MQKILVVDDEASIGKALKMGLSSSETIVDVAESGSMGVELGIADRYDVLIADLCLPDIDGLEVIKKVKAFSPDIVSVIMTGNPSTKSLEKATEQKVAAYLEKPLDMKMVKDAVRLGLEKKSSEKRALRQPGKGGHDDNDQACGKTSTADYFQPPSAKGKAP